jgi:choline monooxygenase
VTRSLPYSAYTDPEFLARERRQVFARSWQYAGNVGDLPEVGSCLPMTINDLPIVLTRTRDDVNALVNVCAHRGSLVCTNSLTAESLKCPYHAWRYRLDGTLITAPRSDREAGFDPTAHGLETLEVGRWGPFIFVAMSHDVPDFEEFLADIPDQVKAAGIDVDDLVFHSRASSDLKANWKVCAENFLECYHCRVAHPGFSKAIDTSPDGYELITAQGYSTQFGPVRPNWTGEFDPTGEIGRSQFHFIFPNTVINIMPGESNLSIGPMIPSGPQTTHRFLDYFFGPDVSAEWIESMIEFDDQVGREDVELVETMQFGLAARPQRTGTLFVDSELLIGHFEDYIRAAIDQD